MKRAVITYLFMVSCFCATAQNLPGFTATGTFDEQEINISDQWKNVVISINAPLQFHRKGKTYLVLYALPNGNSIEWTKGKHTTPNDDWHFDIQHIAAQTRYIRNADNNNNYIVAYVMAAQKSWPAWKRSTPDSLHIIKNIVDSVCNIFRAYHPSVILSSHSGGGSFVFGYIDAVQEIPRQIEKLIFIDSEYGYSDTMHATKLIHWLKDNPLSKLVALAYNDSVVIYNGKPLVSPTGGTWYRTRLMQHNLSTAFSFSTSSDTAFITHTALHNQITIVLKENPHAQIYHTEQVARNGFIFSLLLTNMHKRNKMYTYFGPRVYEKYIGNTP